MYPKIIIDGYNMIHQVAELRRYLDDNLECARDQLIGQLRAYRSRKRVKITLVFDGNNVASANVNPSGVDVIFSHPPLKADPIIKALIEKEKNRKAVTIVTSDKAIVAFANQLGARTISPETFYNRISIRAPEVELNSKYNGILSSEELREWLRLFGEDDEH
ncbi:MAG: NYN domain-containing protein [candidate division KSB1 bacterium]|nr:NYN domain-containing protein [candidate division KSB1 bacterium]